MTLKDKLMCDNLNYHNTPVFNYREQDVKGAVLEFQNKIIYYSGDYKEIRKLHKEIFGDFEE